MRPNITSVSHWKFTLTWLRKRVKTLATYSPTSLIKQIHYEWNNRPCKISEPFFEEYLPLERGLSKHTIRSYSDTFTMWYAFSSAKRNSLPIRLCWNISHGKMLLTFKLAWGHAWQFLYDTQLPAGIFTCFCYFMQYQDVRNIGKWQEVLTIKAKRTEQATVSFLTQEGMTTLLAQIPTDTIQGRRHLAI